MKCPQCQADVAPGAPQAPFCCERCQLLDLGRWLGEGYRVAGDPQTDEELPPDNFDD